jgi:hypothetical protein
MSSLTHQPIHLGLLLATSLNSGATSHPFPSWSSLESARLGFVTHSGANSAKLTAAVSGFTLNLRQASQS